MSNPDLRETVPDDSGAPAALPARPARPERLGQYVLLELLGQGGMGSVYKARHDLLDRVVALKVLSPARLADPQAVARFLREIKAVGKLHHPNLVHGTDAGQADGRHFLVMEFLHGIDLGKLVQQLGPLPVADACELVRQAALGLQHAHEHELVHRDVKPSNLLLTPAVQVKVLDLGLARLLGEVPLGDELTDTGQYMGTADYMAPEQGFDAHAVDIRADVYSLGCTLYKLLTGRAPFSGPEYDSTFKKIRAHSQIPIPPVRDTRPDVPEELVAVLGRMLAKLPGDRFATPADAAEALRPFTTGCDLPGLLTRARDMNEISTSEPSPLEPHPFITPVLTSKAWGTTKPAPRGAGLSNRLRYVVGAGLLGALAIFLIWAFLNWTGPADDSTRTNPDVRAGPGDPADEEPTPGEWRDLMARAPAKLHWPRDVRLSPLHYSGPGQPLWATCSNASGLLAFGRAPRSTS